LAFSSPRTIKPPQSTIAHVGMGAFGCDTTTVDCLSLDRRHATTPGCHSGAITGARRYRTIFGSAWRREQINTLGMQHFDISSAFEAAVSQHLPRT
jgi:hypothetical protein